MQCNNQCDAPATPQGVLDIDPVHQSQSWGDCQDVRPGVSGLHETEDDQDRGHHHRPPQHGNVIFVWQVAVAEEMRGQGLARAMLRELLARSALRGCRYLETTVSPSNEASRRLFHGLGRELRAPVSERALFGEHDFGEEHHECEALIRIGPFAGA